MGRLTSALAIAAVTVAAAGTSRADFKYTQQSKVTGGMLAGVTKTLGVFSKSARQATEPQTSTTMVHGNRMRTERTESIEIIDLDGKRFIHIDPTKKTYWVQTFEQMKQQIEQAKEKAKEEQAKAAAKHDSASNVTIVPKFDVQATGQTRNVMDIPAKEMKMRVDMTYKSTDPKTEADLEKSNAATWMTGDSWYGEVPGYDEIRQFNVKLAKELDWLPGSMGISNSQISAAADEFRKNSIKMDGMPLLIYSSMGMSATGQSGQAGAQSPPPQQQSSTDSSTPTNPRDALAKSFGGLFKKKQQSDSSANPGGTSAPSNVPPPPAPVAGSMMDITTQVTSYSKDSLDASLFDVPAGYTQMQPGPSGK